ncbi:MAG: AAA family ATPase [Actinomycetota bacterium]|nr:AAA family ATPase [Actinomycetota bacterium]
MTPPIDFRILGSLEANVDGQLVHVGGARRRTALAVFLLHPGEMISVERLIDSLWGDRTPENAVTVVYGHILAFRKLFGRDVVLTQAPGYVLNVDPDRIDAGRFERLLTEARQAEGRERAALLGEALSLWRGAPLADVEHDWFGEPELTRLRELHVQALEDRAEAELAGGRARELVAELETLVGAHPLRERLWEQLMLALYRSGRQGDALHAYQRARQVLARELGIDPGPVLRRLEAQILEHDPELDGAGREAIESLRSPGITRGTPPGPRAGETSPRVALERRFATAVFADIVGSTSLAEREDPEVVQSILQRTFDRLAPVVTAHGGVVENVMGDALLAMFGVSVTHEDDPERAVRAALGILAALDDLGREFAAEGKPPLAVHVGIEAGEVVVHSQGPGRMITGDAVNVASRLQNSAEPGSIVVGPTVYSLTKGAVDYRRLPALALKGKADPVQAWVALRATGEVSQRPSSGLGAHLIGRDAELSLLGHTFERAVAENRPALVTVLGPAGVGKSRLALEFLAQFERSSRPALCRKGRCRAYGDVSYSALAEAVKNHCGILDDDPPDAATEKVARATEALFGDRGLAPHVSALVGARTDHSFAREELFDAWRRVLERMAARGPLVLVLEDIHWADDGLLDFVDHLADWAQGPMLVLTLARPELLERRPGWGGGKRNYAAIYLDPLTRAQTREMLTDLLSGSLPESLVSMVFDRSEGNPLFSEEIVRMLIDRGVISDAGSGCWEVPTALGGVEVPRSIHALIAARLDALPEAEKTVLQGAAVVGRTFWVGAAQRLCGGGEQGIREVLGRLRVKELIVPREPSSFSGEDEFTFRHALIRDVAYESLPKSLRADKHMAVARWAEDQAGERRDEIAELLATHGVESIRYLHELGEADDRCSVVERSSYAWARAAGDRAMRLWEQRNALKWFGAALDLSGRVGAPIPEVAAIWESIARASEDVEPYPEVATALEQALALFDEIGMEREAGRVEARLAYVAHQQGDHADVVVAADRALRRLEPLGENADLALALHVRGWHEFRKTRYASAEEYLLRAMGVAGRVGDQVTRGQAMVSLAFVQQQTGRGQESVALFEDALALARRAGDLPLLLRVLTHICGVIQEFIGDYRRCEGYAREGLELARRAGNVGNVGWTAQMLSDLLVDMGRIDEAESAVQEALAASRTVGDTLVTGYALQRIAYLRAIRAQPDGAQEALDEARSVAGDHTEPWLLGWDPLIAGHIAQGRGDDAGAAQILASGARPMLEHLFVWGGKSLLLECVRALVKVGRPEEAECFRERLAALATASVPAQAILAWADGLLEATPEEQRRKLAAAAAQLEELGQLIELGRCLTDLAGAEHRAGGDATITTERAREALRSCGVGLFVRELSGST